MRVLVLYAHPVENSFVAAAHACVVSSLEARGHAVDDCDLYAEQFDPVLTRQDRLDYHDAGADRSRVAGYIERLKAAEALVLVHPVWNYGYPAILKGFFDRVFLPGVSFEMDKAGQVSLTLRHIRRLASVCTYGGGRLRTVLVGDPPRRLMTRVWRAHVARNASFNYLPCYGMNHATLERRLAYLQTVRTVFDAW